MPGAVLLTAVSSDMQKPEDVVMGIFHLAEGQSVHPSAHVNFNCPCHWASAGLELMQSLQVITALWIRSSVYFH